MTKIGSCSEQFGIITDVGGDISLWQPERATMVRPGAINCAATNYFGTHAFVIGRKY